MLVQRRRHRSADLGDTVQADPVGTVDDDLDQPAPPPPWPDPAARARPGSRPGRRRRPAPGCGTRIFAVAPLTRPPLHEVSVQRLHLAEPIRTAATPAGAALTDRGCQAYLV